MTRKKTPALVQNLATNLRAQRRAAGLSQVHVSKKSGLCVAYISLLERGGRTAPLNTVEKLAKAIGVEPHTLLVPPDADTIAAAA